MNISLRLKSGVDAYELLSHKYAHSLMTILSVVT